MQNLRSYKQQLSENHHRGLVIISGSWEFCLTQLPKNQANHWWLGDNALADYNVVSNKQAQQVLGQECDGLVINGHDGIDLNALGAISGCLIAGGICYLLTPKLDQWSRLPDSQRARFDAYSEKPNQQRHNHTISHLVNIIGECDDIVQIFEENKQFPTLQSAHYNNQAIHPYKTIEQQQAVEKIIKTVTGHRNRPLVLTADRGRGKSSALGIAAAKLIADGKQKIIITAPNILCVEPVFARAIALCPQTKDKLQFVAIDQLIATKPKADLIMIDEAAAIPAPLLTQLLSHYSRLVFTSTLSGYEGTGRGFEIRFKAKLNQLTPSWRAFHMLTPIRFAPNDILENFVNRALMLELTSNNIEQIPTKLQLTHWQSDQLVTQNSKLNQIFSLLTLAHYKTSPNDLRHLLDGNNINVFSFGDENHIVAVALIAIEGDIPESLMTPINQGNRRVRGHLIPQSLSYHCGFTDATGFKYARVIRIAVHPDIQQQNIGSQLLSELEKYYRQEKIDFIGASFGANQALIDFWQKNHYQPVRLGQTIEATSNEYSLIVLKSLSTSTTSTLENYQQAFVQQLPQQLIEHCEKLSAQVVMQLLNAANNQSLTSPNLQQQKLINYSQHQLDYEYCIPQLYHWLQHTIVTDLAKLKQLTAEQQSLLIDKIIRKQSWETVCQTHNISGKKLAAKTLKMVITSLIN